MANKESKTFDRSRAVLRRIVGFSALACVLTACLLSIDESKIEALDPNDPGNETGTGLRDSGNPYIDPPVKDAEPPIETDDGALACNPGLMLCGDTCFDTTGTKEHCGVCDKKCGDIESCKASKCTPPSTCKELLALAPSTPTGVHNLTIAGVVVPVYCDMASEGGGFNLVYRITGGIAGDPYTLWMGGGVNDTNAGEATPLATFKHYVSGILGGWNNGFTVTDVRIRLLNSPGGQVLKELRFNGSGSSRENWFARLRMQTPIDWTDLDPATLNTDNVFSPMGHNDERRRWFITRPYPGTGCPDDEGWLMVHATHAAPKCDYEKPMPTIKIFYANGTTSQKWSAGGTPAASMAIFAR